MAVAFAEIGLEVVGVDADAKKVATIGSGISYVEDVSSERLGSYVGTGKLWATTNYEALGDATRLPLMPYNTQRWPAEMFERLARIPSIVGVKDPCEDDLPMFRAIQRLGGRFVWIGNKRHDRAWSISAIRWAWRASPPAWRTSYRSRSCACTRQR